METIANHGTNETALNQQASVKMEPPPEEAHESTEAANGKQLVNGINTREEKKGLALRTQTLEDFLEKDLPPKEPLIEGVLYRRDTISLVGRRRHGKTTLIGNLSLALSLPLSDFLGYSIPQPFR